jgi:hypothetical protein
VTATEDPAPTAVTPSAPPRNLVWRQLRKGGVVVVGGALLLVGGVLFLIPGPPGWPLILGGLALLATEFDWARSLLKRKQAETKPEAVE